MDEEFARPMFARALPVVLMIPCLGGCLFTEPMWAAPAACWSSGIRAETKTCSRRSRSAPTGARPSRSAGDKLKPEEIVRDLPESQREQLRAARFTLHGRAWCERLEANPRFRKVGWPTDGKSVGHDDTFEPVARSDDPCDRPPPAVRVRAYRLARRWTEAEQDAMPSPVGSPQTYPADACVLVLLYVQPRPPDRRAVAHVKAALWTPVSLLGDAVLIPHITIMCYGFGLCP